MLKKMVNKLAMLLAIESSGNSGGAALLRGGELVAESSLPSPRSHGEHLIPCIQAAMAEAAVTFEEIDAIALNVGPGSYTGLRVGLAAAEMLALVHDIPLLAVPCMDALCEAAIRQGVDSGALLPALDARRGFAVGARFHWNGETLARLTEDELQEPVALFEEGGMVLGDAGVVYADQLGKAVAFEGRNELLASDLGLAALRLYRSASDASALRQITTRRVELAYFRPIMAQTVAERQAIADAKAAK